MGRTSPGPTPNTPLPRELNPHAAYERLYRAGTTPAGDAQRLDEYLSVMRSIEQRVEKSASGERRN